VSMRHPMREWVGSLPGGRITLQVVSLTLPRVVSLTLPQGHLIAHTRTNVRVHAPTHTHTGALVRAGHLRLPHGLVPTECADALAVTPAPRHARKGDRPLGTQPRI
jgi:hypothetical protein